MRNIWKVGALGAVFGAVLSVGGCNDFDTAYEKCVSEGRCAPDAGVADAGDGGDAGQVDPEPTCTPASDMDEPDPEGRDLNCDGVDGMASAGYFVDPERGDDGNDGSALLPLKTLTTAIERIRTDADGSGRKSVYLGVGTYNESPIVVTTPVSLHGGYQWVTPGFRYWSRFQTSVPTFIDGGTLAVTVSDVTNASVLLDTLHIVSANAANFSEPSIALRVLNSGNVMLQQMVVVAGNGGPGRDGSDGDAGTAGGNGSPGVDSNGSNAGGGAGGASGCDAQRVGGKGGKGLPTAAGESGDDGGPSAGGGRGGDGGPKTTVTDAGCNEFVCTCDALAGAAGLAGANGGGGTAGKAGTGDGSLSAGLWVAGTPAEKGTPGKPGTAGGGGGAGGSCDFNAGPIATGGGGGGGGGAGCGGMEGRGGENGGASIALLVSQAQVLVNPATTLRAGNGGPGGRGGAGGPGGSGGEPGLGGKRIAPLEGLPNLGETRKASTTGGPGGSGGKGGSGGIGGAGGGGRGGPSVVSWCSGGAITFTDPVTRVAGSGGPGGISDGGINGTQGIAELSVGCP